MGFHFDDCDCGDEVYGNVFLNVARGMEWPNWNQPCTSWALEEMANALDEVFVDAFRGDFRPKPGSSPAKRLPSLAKRLEAVPMGK